MAVLSDCTSSNTEEIQQSNLRDMANVGAQILTSADFISGMEIRDTVSLARESVER